MNTTNTEKKHYAKRDPESQGIHYINHVAAMTGEGLHAKSAIAAELAHRDIEIERLRAALAAPAPPDAPAEAHQLHGDAKLAHDQCRAVVSLANSVAEVYAARAAIVEHDNSLADLIGYASAAAMEWLGDELNAMDAAEEEDEWIDPIFDAAQERWPQPSAALPDAREKLRTDVARAIWEVMREYEDRCDMELEDVGCSHVVWQLANAAIAAQQGDAA